MNDYFVNEGIQIQIQENGKVIWINVDGVCVIRLINSNNKMIEIEDNRKLQETPTCQSNQMNIKFEKEIER